MLPAGERRSQVVNLIDVTATMLDATGAPPLPDADGVSFLNVARDGSAPWRNLTFSEYCQGSMFDWGVPGLTLNRMVRDGRYKLNYYHGMPSQLFDLESDPDEQHDLADDTAYAAVRAQLEALVLRDWDPLAIGAEIEGNIAKKALLQAWARQVQPASTHMWEMLPQYNRLDYRRNTTPPSQPVNRASSTAAMP